MPPLSPFVHSPLGAPKKKAETLLAVGGVKGLGLLKVFFCVVGLNGLGLNHHGGVAAREVLAFVGDDPRHVAR